MLIFYIICGGVFTYVIVNIILDNSSKEEKVETTLVDKKTDTFIDANNMICEEYFLIFLIETQEKRFRISYKTYKNFDIFDKEILTYKRNKFVSFIKN